MNHSFAIILIWTKCIFTHLNRVVPPSPTKELCRPVLVEIDSVVKLYNEAYIYGNATTTMTDIE